MEIRAKKVYYWMIIFLNTIFPGILGVFLFVSFKKDTFVYESILIFIFFIVGQFIFSIFIMKDKIIISNNTIKFYNILENILQIDIEDIIEITGGVVTLTFKYKDENNRIKKIYVINQFGDKLEKLIRELDAKNLNIQHDDIKYLKPWV